MTSPHGETLLYGFFFGMGWTVANWVWMCGWVVVRTLIWKVTS